LIDLELEAKTLNAMCSFGQCLDYGIAEIKKEYFHEPMNRKIFETIKHMYSAGKTVSLMTVYEEIKTILSKNHTKWMMVDQSFCSRAEIEYIVGKLKENYKLRELYRVALNISKRINDGDNINEILSELQDRVYGINVEATDVHIVTPEERATSILTTIVDRVNNKSSGGIKTSYGKLNKIINGGYQPGELIILGAETGRGKTAFSLNLSRDIAIMQKYELLYVNTEMNEQQIDIRLATLLTREHAGIKYSDIATGNLQPCQVDVLAENLTLMSQSKFYNVTLPELTVDQVISVANKFKSQKGIKVLIVDYIGRMETTDPKLKEYQVMRSIAKKLKTLAQRLGITVIMLAQLTEEEKLEGAKAIKNEADLFMYLQEMNEANRKEYEKKGGYNYFLVIDKNRNGPKGKILLKFNGEKMDFTGEA
jgi:replicative DNA helicase